jgi:hypothetical protein
LSITVRLPTKENRLPFSPSSVFHIQYIYIYTAAYLYMYIYIEKQNYILSVVFFSIGNRKWKPRLFSLLRYRLLIVQTELVVCPFVDEEINGSYLS